MPKTKAAENRDQHDHRVTVLVLIGLCICLPHFTRALKRTAEHTSQEHSHHRLIWLETAAPPDDSLYWLDNSSWNWPTILAALDQHKQGLNRALGRPKSPVDSPPLADGNILPAYRLPADDVPQAIPFPVRLAPIFFQPIPINQASLEVLMTIPGVGRGMAASIIDYRKRAGGIKDRTALLAIEGIGEKKAAIIEKNIRFE